MRLEAVAKFLAMHKKLVSLLQNALSLFWIYYPLNIITEPRNSQCSWRVIWTHWSWSQVCYNRRLKLKVLALSSILQIEDRLLKNEINLLIERKILYFNNAIICYTRMAFGLQTSWTLIFTFLYLVRLLIWSCIWITVLGVGKSCKEFIFYSWLDSAWEIEWQHCWATSLLQTMKQAKWNLLRIHYNVPDVLSFRYRLVPSNFLAMGWKRRQVKGWAYMTHTHSPQK